MRSFRPCGLADYEDELQARRDWPPRAAELGASRCASQRRLGLRLPHAGSSVCTACRLLTWRRCGCLAPNSTPTIHLFSCLSTSTPTNPSVLMPRRPRNHVLAPDSAAS
eukprot:6183366-Pleurochrysis_carterae.AAC.1